MKYKLLATDMDGTLYNSQIQITDVTKNAIKKAVEKGIIFTVSTGRPVMGLSSVIEIFDADFPFITYNGAVVIMCRSRKKLYEKLLAENYAARIINAGRELGATMVVWKNDISYIDRINDQTEEYGRLSSIPPVLIENFDDVIKGGVIKIIWHDKPEIINKYQNKMNKLLGKDVNCHTSLPSYLEFVDKDASKAIALSKIGEVYNIHQSEMIAVGDGYNDISMIEYTGLGVAMGNAPDEVKNKADYVTETNDRDGVAHVIDKFILHN